VTKERFGGISKRGNIYLRKLLIHGARAAARRYQGYGFGASEGCIVRQPLCGYPTVNPTSISRYGCLT
jgi:hypothetical protein